MHILGTGGGGYSGSNDLYHLLSGTETTVTTALETTKLRFGWEPEWSFEEGERTVEDDR